MIARAAIATSAVALATLAGCAADRERSGLFEPYRYSIPQGNYVNGQMLDQVRPGMSRDQVRNALGTPLLSDPFHPDRWDYVFRFRYANGDTQLRRITVNFANETVASVDRLDPIPERDDRSDTALPGYSPKRARERNQAQRPGGGGGGVGAPPEAAP